MKDKIIEDKKTAMSTGATYLKKSLADIVTGAVIGAAFDALLYKPGYDDTVAATVIDAACIALPFGVLHAMREGKYAGLKSGAGVFVGSLAGQTLVYILRTYG